MGSVLALISSLSPSPMQLK